jgi:hypothetical protein
MSSDLGHNMMCAAHGIDSAGDLASEAHAITISGRRSAKHHPATPHYATGHIGDRK